MSINSRSCKINRYSDFCTGLLDIMLTYGQERATIYPYLSTSDSPSSPTFCRSHDLGCRICTCPDGLRPLVGCLHDAILGLRIVSQQSMGAVSHRVQLMASCTYEARENAHRFSLVKSHDLHIGSFELELGSESYQRLAIALQSTNQF